MLNSPELEKQLLSALIKYPDSFTSISSLISEDDFYTAHGSYVHQTIYKMIKRSHESGAGEVLDEVILIERLKAASVSFVDNIDIGDYIRSLLLKKTSEESVLSVATELKTYSVRRDISEQCGLIQDKLKKTSGASVPDLIRMADKLYNEKIDFYSQENMRPKNIYDDIEEVLEDLADNPRDQGMMTPHMPYLNRMYGSLLRPGNISVICARTGVGKTTFCLDFVTKISASNNNVPILHFDNGEMTELELQMRQASALSGVPMYLIETGKWRNSSYVDPSTLKEFSAEETRTKVYEAVKKMKAGLNFNYFDVAGLTVNEMIQVARRFYYSQVGRGNPMILSFDYIKTTNEMSNANKSSWDLIGEMVDKFKQFVKKEVTFNNRPMIGMLTSVQSNRTGIVGNRGPDAIIEDDSIIAGSDKINSFCSHLFILRPRLPQELQVEPACYGRATHRLKCVKNRHLGEDKNRATEPVLIPSLDDDGGAVGNNRSEANALLLRIDNFGVEEVGDLRDLADQMRTQGIAPDQDGDFI